MARAKTKKLKTKKAVSKTKKVLVRKNKKAATAKPRPQKTVGLPRSKTIKINKATQAFLVGKKITTLLLPAKIEPVIISQPQTINKHSSRLSPHVLDLKKIHLSKQMVETKQKEYAAVLAQELAQIINHRGKKISKNLLAFYTALRPEPKIKPALPAPKLIKRTQTLKLSWPQLPKLKLPKLSWPEFNWHLPKLIPDEITLGNFIIPANWKKAILAFVIFALVIILPFGAYDYYRQLEGKKNDVMQKLAQALTHLTTSQTAASASDLTATQTELEAAGQNFSQAKQNLDDVNLIVKEVIKLIPQVNDKWQSANKLLDIGEKLSTSAAVLTQAIEDINLSPTKNDNALATLNLNDKLLSLRDKINLILPDLKVATAELDDIDFTTVPAEYQNKLKILQTALPVLEKNIDNFSANSDLILKILGQDTKKRYLLLFQNNNELRPTGGFIGSFAMVDIDRGNIKKIDIPGGGPYDLKAGLKVNLQPPYPLLPLNERWEFQDANWFADLPTSANKLIWLYEKSGGPTVDGLIFINATFLEKILEITGPIELNNYGLTISADNFFAKVQEQTELNYDKQTNRPKQIIADLTPKVLDSLLHLNKKQFPEIMDVIFNALTTKEIQLYFTDYPLEKMVLNNNWGGQLKTADQDYLNIVSSNIGAEKTDAKINYQADLKADIQPDGSIINTLKITKNHTGIQGEIFYGAANLDYLRVYVPRGSELISAEGFEPTNEEYIAAAETNTSAQKDPDLRAIELTRKIDPGSQTESYLETDKTVFANWVKVEPGQSQTVTLKYKLPFTLDLKEQTAKTGLIAGLLKNLNLADQPDQLGEYSLLWQKQSGVRNFNLALEVNFPTNYSFPFVYPANFDLNNNSISLKNISLDQDKIFAVIFGPF